VSGFCRAFVLLMLLAMFCLTVEYENRVMRETM